MREVGVLQPVVVREVSPGEYQLIMGERRWRASQAAGVATVPAIIRDTADTDLLRDALLENLHRQQLNPLEEGAAYQQLLEEFDGTHEELASRLGKSRSHVSNTMRLLNLPPSVQRRVAAGVLSAGHARALLALDDPDAQERLAHRIVAEGLSVRAVEEIVTLGETGKPAKPVRRQARPTAPGPHLAGQPALGPLRDPGQGRARPVQGQDHAGVRLRRRPRTHRRGHGPGCAGRRPARLRRCQRYGRGIAP